MKKYAFLTIAIVTVLLGYQAKAQQSVDSVFDKYYKATGGDTLWNKIQSYTLSRQYRSGSASDYDADIRVSFKDQSMYKNRIISKRGFIFGFSPSDAWYKVPLGAGNQAVSYQTNNLSSAEQNNLKIEMFESLAPFFQYKTRGFVATYVGQEKLDNKTVDRIELQGNNLRYNLYFDTTTGLLTKYTKLENGVENSFAFSNYKASKIGIKYPGTFVISGKNMAKPLTVTSAIEFNEPIAVTFFKR